MLTKPFRYTAVVLHIVCGGIGLCSAQHAPVVGKTYAQSKEGFIPPINIAKGSPNIIWILLDDAGFGASSSFGGMVPTPTLDGLANGGLRYTNFHTTGVCAPTRAALMTGRNHHRVGMGLFPHEFMSAGFPGYSGRMESKDGTVAEYLREAGYSTYAIGKWHLTPDGEQTDLGPFDRWPSGKGFDHFFGFLGGSEDQYKTNLVEDNTHVKPDGRHLNAQLFDKAIFYIDRQRKLNSEKPFFMYIAPGATHSPHQVDPQWLEKYKGKFDDGWDVFRQRILEQQKRLELIPKDAELPPRDPRVPSWEELSADRKKIYARFMESYAGFLDYTDSEIGRLVGYLRQENLLGNTAVFVIIGDNGASKEGGSNGIIYPEVKAPTGDDSEQIADLLTHFNHIGTRATFSNYPNGWSEAANTPFRAWKTDANAEGGTRNPLIVSWPGHIPAGETRNQYAHVIDLLPTTLEITGAHIPASLRNIKQEPIQGISLRYSFAEEAAPTRRRVQYYYLFGAGAIVKDGWKASFGYRPDSWDLFRTYPPPLPSSVVNNAGKEIWELYDLNADFNERRNVATENPTKLQEMKILFDREVRANDAYPLINFSDLYRKLFEANQSGKTTTMIGTGQSAPDE